MITSGISWRGIFLVNVPVGVAALAVTAWRVDESRQARAPRPDWPGVTVLTAALIGLIYGLIRASETAWSDAGVIASLAAGVVLVGVFVAVER